MVEWVVCESRYFYYRDTIDSVKQSAALCLLRLIRANPDSVPMSEWASRVIHLLNDQHMVRKVKTTVSYVRVATAQGKRGI